MDSAGISGQKNTCGVRVRYYRNKLKLTQSELAARCQVAGLDFTRDTIASIEGRRRWVRDYELLTLCDVLNISADDILCRRGRAGVNPHRPVSS